MFFEKKKKKKILVSKKIFLKVTSFLVVTNIFARPIILPD